ncbi:NEDD8-activating enzyme E1 regulatory subunit [Pseudocercospora fuligena]|uniref:NEDD8-activating enzyme E1 regulatory subunit n=1 Tax=Pseudocercospora fuligena TaxID=685502 RepID=A0A8H6R996_9PEZI|nr:NEDD8-activating enzyme E1 regulatory subunit [Pseudocercospora fuligena]
MAAVSPVKEVPPPLQDIPTAKERKYDRQLRLWGATGQIALEESHILLINNGPGVTGVETLKNIVLPGVGQFTILDSALVSEADLGVNFFLEDSSLGKFRAEETAKYLTELNPDVKGNFITEPLDSWAMKDNLFAPYNLVLIAAPIDPTVFFLISEHLQKLQIPAFYIHSLGYFSHFSLYLPTAFPIVDTHPDPTATTDLRLLTPWPELLDFARKKTANMSKMKEDEFAHIPYVCLLLHYLEEWKKEHGKLPGSYKEKTAFRALVRSGSPSEENFDEACAAVLKTLNPPTAPSSVLEILKAPEVVQLTPTSPPFWLIANAVSQFYAKHGELPLPGAVPDMKAQSETYIELQNIYKQKARKDAAEVLSIVRDLEAKTQRASDLAIAEAEVENFCKGAAHISLVRGRPFEIVEPGAKATFGDRAKFLCNELTNPESLVGLYIAFYAWDLFAASHDSGAAVSVGTALQAAGAHNYEQDADKLAEVAQTVVDGIINVAGTRIEDPEYSNIKTTVGNYARELARAGGGELHNVASLSGGLIAQEVIKVITKQYVPIDNTCVYDGITSRTWVGRI